MAEIREGFKELTDCYGNHIKDVIKELKEANDKGLKRYVEFNQHILYSDIHNELEETYKFMHGITYTESEERYLKLREEVKKNEEDLILTHHNTFQRLAQYGRDLGITGELLLKWDKDCFDDTYGTYKGLLMKAVNEALKSDNPQETINAQNHSGFSHSIVTELVIKYGKKD